MNCFFVKTNSSKDPDGRLTGRIFDHLKSKGATVCDISELSGIPPAPMKEGACCIVLGGDGTMLEAAHDVFHYGLPLIGVNLGTVGYLTEIDPLNIEPALDQLLSGDYTIESRMMLHGVMEDGFSYMALNDIVIARHGGIHMNRYRLFVNDKPLYTYRADGVILATPTGSTGYNLSAGGPIVDPQAQMTLMTPICASQVSPGSIVLSPDDVVTVLVEEAGGEKRSAVSFDGTTERMIEEGQRVVIMRAPYTTGIIRLHRLSFMEVLYQKGRAYEKKQTGKDN